MSPIYLPVSNAERKNDRVFRIIKAKGENGYSKIENRKWKWKDKLKISRSALVNLTHQQIAEELGTNRVVVSRLLKKLETAGRLLLYRNQIKLLRAL